jgi:hypothetical protein
MNSHRQYLSLGVVMAEYMTKSCLAYLPPGEQHLCDQMLHGVGVDLQSVGLGTVGQSAMAVAFTGAGLQPPPPPPPPQQQQQQQQAAPYGALAAVHTAMRELQTIAALACPLPPAMHAHFLRLLPVRGAQVASVEAYGAAGGAVWTKGGLAGAALDRLTLPELEGAYARWHALAVRGEALMRAASIIII